MDWDKYYTEQKPFPTYKGVRYQRGNGLGNIFKKFFRWIVPIVKDHAVPVLKDVGKKIGESVLTGTTNFAKDALEGKDFKESAKERFDETTKDLKNIVKDHAVPVLKDAGKKVGDSLLTGTRNFAKDALEGKDIKESAKDRFDETKKDLKSKFSLSGKGINKRKRKRKMIQTLNKKIKRDIFD
jgi:hypothetical protein